MLETCDTDPDIALLRELRDNDVLDQTEFMHRLLDLVDDAQGDDEKERGV